MVLPLINTMESQEEEFSLNICENGLFQSSSFTYGPTTPGQSNCCVFKDTVSKMFETSYLLDSQAETLDESYFGESVSVNQPTDGDGKVKGSPYSKIPSQFVGHRG